ncbi:hypothetical protein Lepto7376_0702 [[Leptolyngbya] sp. PCC 7376]|nr:hypothetical protein Lepto7376_0702 [[Leptolyngbya] sp. PCC 7376]
MGFLLFFPYPELTLSRLKMPAADSDDLRCKALAVLARSIPKKDVCEMFGIGLNSLGIAE